MSIEETIYIGHALCSAYRIDETALGGISHREGKDKPLTSAASLARFLDTVPGFCGSAKARRALAYVRDNARSPMESALAMGFGLPVHFGGFGLGEIRLNQPIRLFDGNDSGSRRFVTRIPDLTISARGRDGARRSVLVDFDADSVHASRKGLAKDAARRNQMATINVATHISLSTAQVLEFRSYAHAAEQIRIVLQRQSPLRASAKSRNPHSVAKYYEARERQIALWRKSSVTATFASLSKTSPEIMCQAQLQSSQAQHLASGKARGKVLISCCSRARRAPLRQVAGESKSIRAHRKAERTYRC